MHIAWASFRNAVGDTSDLLKIKINKVATQQFHVPLGTG